MLSEKLKPLSWRPTDLSLSSVTAGFVAVLVGFTSSVALVFQAATALGATTAQISSWIWALSLGMGLCTLLPALWLRQPVMVAWSTPGAAVLAAAGASGGFGMAEATGAFMVCAAVITLLGLTGLFERFQNRIPMPLASALLAGVLTRFSLDACLAIKAWPGLVLLMLGIYLVGKRLLPRYAVPVVLFVGMAYAFAAGQLNFKSVPWGLTVPVFTMPEFNFRAMVSLALPLFVVTMTSQNLPGVAVIRAAGYGMPISKLLTLTGVATFLLAPFGAYSLGLSAVTAAICMGPQAHPDPQKRYMAAASCGVIYWVVGLFGAAVTGILTAFPKELVITIAGLALLSNIGDSLALAMKEKPHREVALITFLVTLSGVSLLGIGSAFWGVVAGTFTLFVMRWRVTASE
jgi:benzoate membrane transport protein